MKAVIRHMLVVVILLMVTISGGMVRAENSDSDVHLLVYQFLKEDGTEIAPEQKVSEGDELVEPQVPKIENQAFDGWYLKNDDGSYERFTSFGTVGPVEQDATITLYARYTHQVYVLYYDLNGNLLESDGYAAGADVTISRDYPIVKMNDLTSKQAGWSTTSDGKTPVGDTLMLGDTDVPLYPITVSGSWVSFDTRGGTYVENQFIPAGGGKVTKPQDPVRDGYQFLGWFTNEGATVPFTFDSDVSQDVTLYAGWQPLQVKYTVSVWADVANAGWSYIGSLEKEAAPDSDLAYKDLDMMAVDGEAIIRNSNGGYMPYVYDADKTHAMNTYLHVSGDGSLQLNLYFRSKTYTIQFYDAYGTYLAGCDLSGRYDVRTYLDPVKYKDILAWTYFNQHYPNGQVIGNQWNYAATEQYLYYSYIDSCKDTGASDIPDHAVFKEYELIHDYNYTGRREVWFETLESCKKSEDNYKQITPRDQNYELKTVLEYDLSGQSEGILMADSPGFSIDYDLTTGAIQKPNRGRVGLYYSYCNKNNRHEATEWYYFDANGKRAVSSTPVTDGTECIVRFYARRLKYSLQVQSAVAEGAPVTGQIDSIPYEDALSNYSSQLQYRDENGNLQPYVADRSECMHNGVKYVFRGFYTDRDFQGAVVDISSMTMPHSNLMLYAKWEPETFTVTFRTGIGEPIDPQTKILYGEQATRPQDPVHDADHIFLGWLNNGHPYNFESKVTSDLTLTAAYRSVDAYPVTYDLNGGTGSVPQDSHRYYEEAGVPVAALLDAKGPDGTVFLGWKWCRSQNVTTAVMKAAVMAAGQGTGYDGQIYYPGSRAPMALHGLTLQAVWGPKAKTAQLRYCFNHGTFGIAQTKDDVIVLQLVNHSMVSAAGIDSLTVVPDGYAFAGWYKDAACNDGPYLQVHVKALQETTLYAKWVPVEKKNKNTTETADTAETTVRASAAPAAVKWIPRTGAE